MGRSLRTELSGNIVLFEGAGKDFEMKRFAVRPLAKGEILVKNHYTTLCGSDLHTYCGLRQEPSPTVLGHEIIGEILEIDPAHAGVDLKGNPLKRGDRITWSIFASNPESYRAKAGMPQKGDDLFKYGHALASAPEVFHGGLAEYCILKTNTAVLKLPDELPQEVAVSLNCSVATVAGALRTAGSVKDKVILITGMGHLGITCAAMCREAGAAWVGAADLVDARLQKSRQFGVDDAIDLHSTSGTKLKSLLPGGSADIVFDMSGSPAAMELGLDMLGVGGVAVWVGAVFSNRKLAINAEQVIRNLLTIKGLHNYNFEDFERALDFMTLNWKKYPFAALVEKVFTLDRAQEAFNYAVAAKPMRVGIDLAAKS